MTRALTLYSDIQLWKLNLRHRRPQLVPFRYNPAHSSILSASVRGPLSRDSDPAIEGLIIGGVQVVALILHLECRRVTLVRPHKTWAI
jgi:hypothetical protein